MRGLGSGLDGLGKGLGGLDADLEDAGALAADLGVEVAVFGKGEGSCLSLRPRDGKQREAVPDKA